MTPPLTADVLTEGLGAFDEVEYLGDGTFGTTFRVVRDDDEYAIKAIHLEGMPEFLWDREITTLRTVEHPNVVAFRRSGFFSAGGRDYPYLETEYIDGGSIKANLDSGRRCDDPSALRALLTGLLAGLAEIHDLGIIHRDIKPANIALRGAEWGDPVLLDFGLAKALDMSTHTAVGQKVGTLQYMSPEQLRGKPARRRSDLFAAAAVVYESGTGAHPFVTPDVMTVQSLYDRIVAGPPKDPRELADFWPDDVATVVLRLLSSTAHARLGINRALRDLEGD